MQKLVEYEMPLQKRAMEETMHRTTAVEAYGKMLSANLMKHQIFLSSIMFFKRIIA